MLVRAEVRAAMLRKLKDSALTESNARTLKFKPLTAAELTKEYPKLTTHPAAGFIIPYFDTDGAPNSFFRYRYLEEPRRSGFDAIVKHKESRYIQPAGQKPRAYFSRLIDWPEVFKGDWLVITEGELKANCAAKHGIPCIGIGGVWNFKSAETIMIDDLASIEWNGKTVFIVFDSDAASNESVVKAENALARELLNVGALVHIVRLPALTEGSKTGLDDYLIARGAEMFGLLLDGTPEWERCRILHYLNEKVLFVHDPGTVIERQSGQRMTPAAFQASIYANYVIEHKAQKKGKEVNVRVSAAHEWIRWPHRAEVIRTTYLPGQPRIVKGEFNAWAGWGLKEELVKPGSIKLWRELISFLFDGATAEDMVWFERWLAYPLQHPGTKLCSATVLWGLNQGTGKTLVGSTMARIYGSNFKEISDRELLGSFNEWAENRQFIMGDEITGGDKRGSADKMKSLITQRFVTINPKFVSPYIVPDCINYYFTSNHPDSFFLEDTDRRYFVHEVKATPLADAFYREYDRWYRSDAVGALFHHLLSLDLGDFNPNSRAPVTSSKIEMLEMGRSELGAWVAQLRETPDTVLKTGEKVLQYSLMTTRELLYVLDPERHTKVTEPGMARELKRAGFARVNNGGTVRTTVAGPVRLWAVRNRDHLSNGTSHKALAELYDKERAMVKAVAKF